MEEMYTIGRHSKREMTTLDAKPTADKTYANTHAYFEILAEQIEKYLGGNFTFKSFKEEVYYNISFNATNKMATGELVNHHGFL